MCGINYLLFDIFLSKGYSGESRVKFWKNLRWKVIAIDWFLIYLITQKETDTTPLSFTKLFIITKKPVLFCEEKINNWHAPNQEDMREYAWAVWINSILSKLKNIVRYSGKK